MYIGLHERAHIATSLAEDVGTGDLTAALLPKNMSARFTIRSREHTVFCGEGLTEAVFSAFDATSTPTLTYHMKNGDTVSPGDVLIEGTAPARALATTERTILNYLRICCAISGFTHNMVAELKGTSAVLLDTRKTLPGLRGLQKQAVRIGGGHNHRFGLFDGIMLKDTHIALHGSITDAMHHARAACPALTKIEVECDTLQQLDEALNARADVIMADNMNCAQLRDAVACRNAFAASSSGVYIPLEASGNITQSRIREVALCGVDYISAGCLTWNPPAVDIGLDMLMP